MDNIMVSVYCMTYNHAGLIRKCLDGFVVQKTDFNFEIWVHDDCSSDGTIEILKEYEERYPELINVVYERENQYSQGKDISTIMKPYFRGKYIALCEGDDCWTDPDKLQKQFNFMEKNPEYTLCTHKVKEVMLEDGSCFEHPKELDHDDTIAPGFIVRKGGGFFPTCSFFRRADVNVIPNRWGSGMCEDFNIILSSMLCGKVYYMDACMGIKHTGYPGSWSSRNTQIEKMVNHKRAAIESMLRFDEETKGKYHEFVEEKVLIDNYRIECEFYENYKKLFTDKYISRSKKYLPKKVIMKTWIKAYFGWFYSLYRSVRQRTKER